MIIYYKSFLLVFYCLAKVHMSANVCLCSSITCMSKHHDIQWYAHHHFGYSISQLPYQIILQYGLVMIHCSLMKIYLIFAFFSFASWLSSKATCASIKIEIDQYDGVILCQIFGSPFLSGLECLYILLLNTDVYLITDMFVM